MTNQQDRKALIKIVHPIKPTSDIQNNDLTINHRISYLINLSATAPCISREFYKSLPSHTNDRKRRRQKAVEIIANLCFGERNCLNCKSLVCELFTNNVVFFCRGFLLCNMVWSSFAAADVYKQFICFITLFKR